MAESALIEDKNAIKFNLHKKNEAVATTAAFVNVLTVDMRSVDEGNLTIHNETAGDLDYEILGTMRDFATIVVPTGTNDDDKGWVSIASASIATTAAIAEVNITLPYTEIVVRIKHTTLTTNADIYFKGNN